MGATGVGVLVWKILLLILLSGVLLTIEAAPAEVTEGVTHPPPEQLQTESRSRKDEDLDLEEDLDGRNAYINNQFVPSEPAEVLEDEQNTPLYEILQKQMEQVLASSAPNDPIYEQHREKQERRDQKPPHQPTYFSGGDRDGELQDDYEDEEDQTDQGYPADPEKPDAVSGAPEDEDAGYQAPSLSLPSSTTRKPYRRRSTTISQPRTTRTRTSAQPRTTARPLNQTSTTEQSTTVTTTTPRPKTSSSIKPKTTSQPGNSASSDPQVYQHKRRIIFKTISTGSQFVNSPIGDLMIKFSIGFAKPITPGGATSTTSPQSSSSEALRALSQNLIRNFELQKLRRANKVQKY
ncbi:proteoglycan 4 [Drosophila teissieri]|uniref:proteoglycan 4 n=1 Tax=Drosophila teissieri TaxID=7243 RepID=UPI001CBA3074|nr:proteoglycan 4 [Drosophila teissieri]